MCRRHSNTNINSTASLCRLWLHQRPLKGRACWNGFIMWGNIIPRAVLSRDCFYRHDLSGVQIEHGKELIELAGSTNITLLEKISWISTIFGTFDTSSCMVNIGAGHGEGQNFQYL